MGARWFFSFLCEKGMQRQSAVLLQQTGLPLEHARLCEKPLARGRLFAGVRSLNRAQLARDSNRSHWIAPRGMGGTGRAAARLCEKPLARGR